MSDSATAKVLRAAAARLREDEDLADLDATVPQLTDTLAEWFEEAADEANYSFSEWGDEVNPRWPGIVLARLIAKVDA